MPNFLSPSVITQEQNNTLYVNATANSVGALAGGFQWGPVNLPTLITNGETQFISQFGKPNNLNAGYVMPLLDFFSYSNSAWVVRQVGPLAKNAFPTGQTAQLITNVNTFSPVTGSDFIAKYAGSLGNGLTISIADSVNFPTWEFNGKFQYAPLAGQYSVAVVDSSGAWTGNGAVAQTEQLSIFGNATSAGSISVFGVSVTLASGDTPAIIATKIAGTAGIISMFSSVSASASGIVTYTYLTPGLKTVEPAPATALGVTFATSISQYGRTGTVLETFELLTNTVGTTLPDGTPTYWYTAINQRSNYIYASDSTMPLTFRNTVLANGVDDYNIVVSSGFQLLSNREAYPLNFLISPAVSVAEQLAILGVAQTRMDCMPFLAPPMAAVVNNTGNEVTALLNWRATGIASESTYGFATDNWGYMFDKYNGIYRWVPTSGGTAGVAAQSFQNTWAWVPFAGFSRGQYLNYSKLAWSASQSARDALYPVGINSIVNFPNQGITLFGDRTLTQRPSAFSRTNVRWAFIIAEQGLSALAQYYLFENNTPFTQAQFVNAATPFLKQMVSEGAFADFEIICNSTNNTQQTVQTNQLVVQVLVKPVYSINWVSLVLEGVSPGTVFTESNQ